MSPLYQREFELQKFKNPAQLQLDQFTPTQAQMPPEINSVLKNDKRLMKPQNPDLPESHFQAPQVA